MKTNKDPYAALRFEEFRFFLFMRFAMVFAWAMQFVIIEWEVYSITKDPWNLALIGLIEFTPALLMALFAGHIVDQKEKKGLLVKCLIGFSVISLGLFLVTIPSVQKALEMSNVLLIIYVLVFLGGFVRAFLGPTVFSLLSLIVPKKNYPNAATWSSSTWQMGRMLGPACAGIFIGFFGVHWSMCIVFAFTIFALIFLSRIETKPIKNPKIGEPVFQSLKEGIRFVFKNKTILGAISLDMFAVLFGGAVALLPIFAQDILKVGPQGFGILHAAPAVGSIITMLLAAYFSLNKNAGKKLLLAIFIFGVSIIIFGISELFWLSVFALFISGLADGVSVVIRNTILQLHTPDNMRGRVSSVNSIFVGSSNELGAFESGVMAKLLGVVPAVVFGGCMTLATVFGTAVAIPKLRDLDLEKEVANLENEE